MGKLNKANNNQTVKLGDILIQRVDVAMELEGCDTFAEFCRQALTERCRKVERTLREEDPKEFKRLYGDILKLEEQKKPS